MTADLDLATLLCSRVCHDLISPIGAVGNGVELLEGAQSLDEDVRGLLTESASKALAALSFFRIAFGSAGGADSMVGGPELSRALRDYVGGGRHSVAWTTPETGLPRPAARALLLMALTAMSATPMGGALRIEAASAQPLALRVAAQGRRVTLPDAARALLSDPAAPAPQAPRDAHFAVLARAAHGMGARVAVALSDDTITVDLI